MNIDNLKPTDFGNFSVIDITLWQTNIAIENGQL